MRMFAGEHSIDQVSSNEAMLRDTVDRQTGSYLGQTPKSADNEETKGDVGILQKRKQPEVAREMMAAKPLVRSKIIQHSQR